MKKDYFLCLMAGLSTRMGTPKQHVKIYENTFLERIMKNFKNSETASAGCIFVGSPSDKVSQRFIEKENCIWLENPDPAPGPLTSIRIALSYMNSESGFWLWPVDFPLVKTETFTKLLIAAEKLPDMIVIPSWQFKRGHPARFPSWCRNHLMNGPLEKGAKYVLQNFPEKIQHIETDDNWVVENINTPETLQKAREIFQKPELA
ncbi:MAG: NTP transferase domain-containing protein [Candidatus Riflebacteria bacterium]|nr:NTP transferase domain-containing protein [Candidatus Riflebacteria bacterium]